MVKSGGKLQPFGFSSGFVVKFMLVTTPEKRTAKTSSRVPWKKVKLSGVSMTG